MPMTPEQIDRYARHLVLREVGGPGAGGLGSPLALYLAVAGVGTLGIIDDDEVALSNLQRQIIHQSASIGRAKVESAKDAIEAITPDVRVIPYKERLTSDNAAAIIREYDVVADGCDNFETRFLVNDTCFFEQKPLVSAAIGEFDGQIATFKGYKADLPCYRCLYPEPPPPGTIPPCAEAGVLGAVAGTVGAWQALEVIREIVGFGEGLAGKLLLFDGLHAGTRTIKLPPDPACALCSAQATIARSD